MRKSLQFKMILLFSILLISACVAISFILYRSSEDLVKSSVGRQAEAIVKQSSKIVDVNQYEQLSKSKNKTDYYEELRQKLNEIRKDNGLKYLYTMARIKTNQGYKYFFVVDGMPLNDPNASGFREEEKGIDSFPLIKKVFETGTKQTEMSMTKEYGGLLSAYLPIKTTNGEIIGLIGADINVNKVYSSLKENQFKIIWTTGLILFLGLLIVYLFSRYLIKPLKELTQDVKQAGKGDLSIHYHDNRSDEIGILSKEFQMMIEQLRNVINGINEHSKKLIQTSNDLSERTSDTIFTSKQITAAIQEISAGAELQNQNSENISKSIEEVTSGVEQIASSSSKVTSMSSNTLLEAENGHKKIQGVINQMNAINQSSLESEKAISALEHRSKEISQIIKVIRDISSQTNLLALNAAIEAARAGEHGKGFAVVADEVRKLAEQTEQSTGQITSLITNMHHDTAHTVEAMEGVTKDAQSGILVAEEAGEAFNKIYESIENVVAQIKEVSSTSNQMAQFAEQIYASISETVNISAQAAANTSSAAHTMKEQDEHVNNIGTSLHSLNKMANELQQLIQHFHL